MQVMFYVLKNKETGLGHWVRCQALNEKLLAMGYQTFFPHDNASVELSEMEYRLGVTSTQANWIIIDLPGKLPDWLFNVKANTLVIDGIAQPAKDKATLIISQGLKGKYHAPEYLILRDDITNWERKPIFNWFVFGGYADSLHLWDAMINLYPEQVFVRPMYHSISQVYEYYNQIIEFSNKSPIQGNVFSGMCMCDKAVVHMGMTVWELAYLGIPTYVISRTKEHLKSALEMQDAGYCLAWPTVGLPDREELKGFLETDFVPHGKPFDAKGIERIVKLMETIN